MCAESFSDAFLSQFGAYSLLENAYYGRHFEEEAKPGLEQIVDKNAVDAAKVIYGERR